MSLATPMRPTPAAAPTDPAPQPLSLRWLGLDWRDHLPWEIDGLRVELGSLDDALAFVAEHYAEIFGATADEGRWLAEPMTPAKRFVLAESDLFIVRDGARAIGLKIAAPTDWSSYYLRSFAFLPEYQGRGIGPQLTTRIEAPLAAAGVTRIEYDTAPVNAANLKATTRMGYVTTGMINSDRWGSLLRRTKYLDPSAVDVFLDQYCAGTWPRCRTSTRMGAEGSSP